MRAGVRGLQGSHAPCCARRWLGGLGGLGAGAGKRRGQPIELGSRLFCLDAGRIIYRTHVFGDKRNVHIDSIPDGFARPLSGA